jgi:hypothetical protein
MKKNDINKSNIGLLNSGLEWPEINFGLKIFSKMYIYIYIYLFF